MWLVSFAFGLCSGNIFRPFRTYLGQYSSLCYRDRDGWGVSNLVLRFTQDTANLTVSYEFEANGGQKTFLAKELNSWQTISQIFKVRNISSVPTFKVTRHFVNEAAAREAVQRKEIYGYLSIPPRFEQDAITGKDATLSYYYHYALLSVGGELMAAFETSLAPVALSPIAMQAVALGVSEQQIETFLLPVQASDHPIYNPSLDYSVYLSQPFFFVLFQVLILLVTVYSVGSEIKFRTGDNWLETAGGNMVTAIAGKLLPYTVIFSLIALLGNYVMFGMLHIPFHGSWLLMNAMTVLFVIATQALALFILFPFPGRSTHYQHCVYGRFIRGNPVRCHFPCAQYVSVGTRRVISLSGTTLHRDHTNHALFRRRFCLSMAFGSDPLRLPPVGIGNDSPLKRAIISHKYENIQ